MTEEARGRPILLDEGRHGDGRAGAQERGHLRRVRRSRPRRFWMSPGKPGKPEEHGLKPGDRVVVEIEAVDPRMRKIELRKAGEAARASR